MTTVEYLRRFFKTQSEQVSVINDSNLTAYWPILNFVNIHRVLTNRSVIDVTTKLKQQSGFS